LILIPLNTQEARRFYARQSIDHRWSKRELDRQIERKAFERAEIADAKLDLAAAPELSGAFKDPYLLDFLGLRSGYLEEDLEQALIRELEQITALRTPEPPSVVPPGLAPAHHSAAPRPPSVFSFPPQSPVSQLSTSALPLHEARPQGPFSSCNPPPYVS
jgi:hypothetical protein